MRLLLLALTLAALSARAADTPLSAILIDGEGWRRMKEDIDFVPLSSGYEAKKSAKGRWGLHKGDKLVAEGAAGEEFGHSALSPRGGQLVLAVPSHHHLYAFQVRPDGSLYAKERCYVLRREKEGKGGSGVKNMVFDAKGRLFVAIPEGVQYFDEEMRFSGLIAPPSRQPVQMVALRGDRLVVECDGGFWQRKIQAKAPAGR